MAPLIITRPYRVAGAPAPAGGCPGSPNRFDNTYWTSTGLTWNGSAWAFPGFGGSAIETLNVIQTGPNDNWEVSYRPADWSITFSEALGGDIPSFNNLDVVIRDTTNAIISQLSFTPFNAGDSKTLRNAINFGANDISQIEITQGIYADLTIDCIAFDVGCTGNSYLDDTYWAEDATTATHTNWNGTSWDIGIGSNASNKFNVIQTGPNDNWEVGFRPSAVEITYFMGTGPFSDSWDFFVRDTSGATIGSVTGVSNGSGTHVVTIPLTFTTFDIGGTGASAALQVDTFAYTGSDRIDGICFLP